MDVTVDLINAFFADYPMYDSIALGISDANEDRNCHCLDCVARYPGYENTLGFADRSDVYYDWCNKVIAGVRESYPDKTFDCIAYRGVTDPPRDVKVDERPIPFLCFGRMLWADPSRAAQDRKLTEAAAPDLVRYFTFMEDFWTNRVPGTAWFSDRSRIYLIFNTRGYLDALTRDDVEQCSQWLAAVEAKAGDGHRLFAPLRPGIHGVV